MAVHQPQIADGTGNLVKLQPWDVDRRSIFAWRCMVADILNSPTGAIHFGLQITSCDCHVEILAGQAANAAKKMQNIGHFWCSYSRPWL